MLPMRSTIQISRFAKICYQSIWVKKLMENSMMSNMTKKLQFHGKLFSILSLKLTMEVE